jgi:phage/plasmid-associated DNA primase
METQVHFIVKPGEEASDEAKMELLKAQVQNLNEEQLLLFIGQLETAWSLDRKGDRWVPIKNGFQHFYSPDELDIDGLPREIDIEKVSDQHKRKQRALGEMYHRAVSLGISTNESTDITGNEYQIATRINRLIDMADDAYETVFRYGRQYDRINHPSLVCADPDSDNTLFRCSTLNTEDLTPYQSLLLAFLQETYVKNIRKYNGHCCKQIITPDGYHTKAWKPFMTIEEFIYSHAQKESRFEIWKNLTSKGNIARDAIKFLTESKDIQFPEIKKNRHVWSFNNGIFIGKEWSIKDGRYICRFYPYDSNEFRCLDPTVVSAKYFDQNFQHFDHIADKDWYSIPTPTFQSILDYQKFDKDVSTWLYVMAGKCCFDAGEIDGWQIMPFLKGIAQSGKSTIITKVIKKFYESEDVKTLSNNIERKFGLSSICDGFMFIAPEVKDDLGLEQAEFQSMVSGEDISIARKHEKAKSIEWKTPGIMAGNMVPGWKDNAGSILRRLLTWNFSKRVSEADPHLDEKLDKELPMILLKCVKAYLQMAQDHHDAAIWNLVPEYFKTIQTQVAMVTNTLHNFMASEKVRFGQDLFVPQKVFTASFNIHCTENNLGRQKFNQDLYQGPFGSRDIEVRNESKIYKGRVYPTQPFIFGLDIIDEGIQMNDEDR